ncbi:MAG: hypothetical protein Q9184_004367 [Pyrenodesmia sp. 2 TL-2023]
MRSQRSIVSVTLTIISIVIFGLCTSATTTAGSSSTESAGNTVTVDTASTAQPASTGGSYPGFRGGSGFGPPPWIGTAIEQYQASLRSASQDAPSATSPIGISPSAQGSTMVSATTTATATPSPSSSPDTKSSSSPHVQNWVIIVAVVIANWLLTAFVIYYCLRRRRHQEKETASPANQPSPFEADDQNHYQRRYEAQGADWQPEMHDTQRLELNGSLPPAARSELPV